ncbi:hypothetical protein AUEXF2481DRAFT_5688 [Aureobasidium subglaciale EXF-2481]|uniref:BZIP domain-containing protein n=1 Tax=Aureobasidium subglaciale (strain EXF-2481) TaxID=1043005 RepID=A0A074YAI7_AURSE|nr:uncharacterized protein AUEXF2481DRAFT_5688 [Aureobasidium subglaciale EXF-2481]KEQ94808.1 hypothetical protein AUEXF2481DRAFT_5688 [Aureobasidium subglaciale EXF-2481]
MPAATKPPRKYKAKPPISALDSAAAQHRRQQSCKAQRAYRQRKEDTIATLSQQILELEGTITNLSACFVGLNDKVLKYLDGIKSNDGEMLARGIGESMGEFKRLIDDEGGIKDTQETEGKVIKKKSKHSQREDSATQTPPATLPTPAPENEHLSPMSIMPHFNTEYPLQRQLPYHQSPSPSTNIQSFSGPTFQGLSIQPYQPLLSAHEITGDLTGLGISQNQHALAYRICIPTIAKAYYLLQNRDIDDPVLRRVFATYYAIHPVYEVKMRVEEMVQRRNDRSVFTKLSERNGWWSAVEVAAYLFEKGVWFDEARDCCVIKGREIVNVEKLIDGIVVDAVCAVDHPEFREETVKRAIDKILG